MAACVWIANDLALILHQVEPFGVGVRLDAEASIPVFAFENRLVNMRYSRLLHDSFRLCYGGTDGFKHELLFVCLKNLNYCFNMQHSY